MSNTYTADGGVTKSPIDEKTNSWWGGGIVGGLDIKPYINDYDLSKTYNAQPNYQPTTTYAQPTNDNGGIFILLAMVIGGLAFIKILFD